MLMGFMPMIQAASGSAASVAYAGLTNSTDISFPTLTVPTGEAAANRYVIIIVYEDNSSGGRFEGLTLGGIDCTKVVVNSPISVGACAIYITNTPLTTGTTASLVFDGGADQALAFATYAAYGINPTVTDTLIAASDDPTGTIDVPAGGILIAGSLCEDEDSTCTWTGVTEAFDSSFGTAEARATAGSYTTTSAVTGRTVKADWSSSFGDKMVAASWGPA